MNFESSLNFAKQLDNKDPLKHFRGEFIIPQHNDKDAIYFLGNSLGLQPKRANEYIQQVLKQWSNHGVEGFFTGEHPWMQYHQQLLPALSEIVGALPQEIVVMNQLTVNLHLMLVSFYQPQASEIKFYVKQRLFQVTNTVYTLM